MYRNPKNSWRSLINQIDATTANTMTRKELSPIVSKLSAVANKRLKRMEAKGIRYGNYDDIDSISGVRKFGAKNKNVGQLKSELLRAIDFLKNELSSLTGIKQVGEEFYKQAKRRGVINNLYKDSESRNRAKDYWESLDKGLRAFIYGKDRGYWTIMGWDSSQARNYCRALSFNNPEWGVEELIDAVDKRFEEYITESETYSYNENDIDTSDFFDVSD